VGHKAVQAILDARRDGGPFRDLYDFCERVDLTCVNKAVIEALIKSGAFDRTGAMRRALINVLDRAFELGQEAQHDQKAGQLTMFGGFAGAAPAPPPPIGSEEWTDSEMLAYEKATLGFYITKHPLAQYEDLIRRFSSTDTAGLARLVDGQQVVLGGLVARLRSVPIRTGRSIGKKLCIATLEDFAGSTDVIVFPGQQQDVLPALKPDAVVFVEGAVDRRREAPSIRTARVVPIERARREYAREVVIKLRNAAAAAETLPAIRQLCRTHRGNCQVYFEVASPAGWTALVKARDSAGIDPSEDFVGQVTALVGVQAVLCCGLRGTVSRA
jgi:DNA polymerase-3 subunit alpha